ncbi:uncharacterized protein LOC144710892 [Wolffia australiana]
MAEKTGKMSTSGERGGEMAVPTPSLKLSKTNYRVCAMSMEVYLDSHNLWQTAKANWEILRQRNLSVDRVIESRIQGLKRNFEMLTMGKIDFVMDFRMKFTGIVSDLRSFGEMMEEKEVVRQLWWATPSKFGALTLSLEQYGEHDKRSKPYWPRGLAKPSCQLGRSPHLVEEDVIMAVAQEAEEVKAEEAFCHLMKTNRRKHLITQVFNLIIDKDMVILHMNAEGLCGLVHSGNDTATPSTLAASTSSLLMAIEEAQSEVLVQGSKFDHHHPDLWYLDTGTTNQMNRNQNFILKLDESTAGFVKFEDNSRIEIRGRGSITILRQDGESIQLAQNRWLLHHLEVKLAFLNGDAEEEIYVKQPDGFIVKGKEGYVLKLKKAL